MNVLSQVAVIALIALVGMAFLFLARGSDEKFLDIGKFRRSKSGPKQGKGPGRTAPGPVTPPEPKPEPGVTMMPPVLYVEQLHPKTMELVERFEVSDVPAMGITISRPNAVHGCIKLNPAVKSAFTVSENHVRIGMDNSGLFIQDQKNDGRMRLAKSKRVVDEVDITDGLVLYLGVQPLRFVIPDLWGSSGDSATVIFDTDYETADQRRTKHFTRRYGR